MRTRPASHGNDFEAFFRAEHPRLVAIGLALTGDREAGRDLAAEALSRAHRSWPRVATKTRPHGSAGLSPTSPPIAADDWGANVAPSPGSPRRPSPGRK